MANATVRSRPPATRPRAVIFDMDGLMLDTEPLAARAWSDAALAVGVQFDVAVTPRLVGRTFADCRTLIAEHHGAVYPVDALMGAWHDAYDAIVEREGIVLKAGLVELLDWLERERIDKAVATSTRHARAEAKLSRLSLLERFCALVGGDDVRRGKPEPDIFLAAAAKLGLAPGECLVLEDSEPGIAAAAAARIPAIMVPDTHAAAPRGDGVAPLVLASLHEVRTHLAALRA
jgi:HAD superfamily hydrolase (TIGR01509 family)